MTLGFTCETHCYQANTIIISVLCNTLQTSLLKKLTLGPVDRSEDRLQQLWKLTNFHNRAQSVTLQKKLLTALVPVHTPPLVLHYSI